MSAAVALSPSGLICSSLLRFLRCCGRWDAWDEEDCKVEAAGRAVDLELEVVGPAFRCVNGRRPERGRSVDISSHGLCR